MAEEQLYEVTVGAYPAKRAEIFAWAHQVFGDRVEQHDSLPLLYFRDLADAEWFVLRWS
jgi:hypothetical protein